MHAFPVGVFPTVSVEATLNEVFGSADFTCGVVAITVPPATCDWWNKFPIRIKVPLDALVVGEPYPQFSVQFTAQWHAVEVIGFLNGYCDSSTGKVYVFDA